MAIPSAWGADVETSLGVKTTGAGRATYVDRFAPLEGGETENGGFHPEIDDVPGEFMALFGTHIVRVPFGFNLTYYTYLDETEVASKLDWVNISLEWRF